MIPNVQKCFDMMKLYGMRPNIVEHSKLVHRVAAGLARLLISQGCKLDITLVEAGALLHDITKTRALETGENHSVTGAQLLSRLGFREVAELVEQHVHLNRQPHENDRVTEMEIVNYADKRVMHDQLVDIGRRFQDIRKRYGTTVDRLEGINRTETQARYVEQKIFSRLAIEPQDLEFLINETN